jgi:hypothetical protein
MKERPTINVYSDIGS